MTETAVRRIARGAPLVYCLIAASLIALEPGPQYDEVLPAMAAVHWGGASEPPYPHDPDTWICGGARCAPLMTLRYAGAVKDYLYLPLYALAGPSIIWLRVLSMLMGVTAIAGLTELVAAGAGWRAALMTAGALAIHPAFLWQTVFDSGLIATWMLAVGLLALALARYTKHRGPASALLVGLAAGFGVWARANFVWLLAALSIGMVFAWRGQILRQWRHLPWLAAGCIVGGFPFLIYQWISGGGTWQALSMYPAEGSPLSLLPARLALLSEVLLADREHRAMWGGTPMPVWQAAAVVGIALFSLFFCLWRGGKMGRAVAVASILLAAVLLSSRMAIGEHHLIVLIPLLAVAAGIAFSVSPKPFGRAAAVLFVACAASWHVTAWQGLWTTGGVGLWSDGSYRLADEIARRYPGREVTFFDWGLRNQTYLLTRGAAPLREVFGTAQQTELGRSWNETLRDGGLFVTNGRRHRQFPGPTEGLRGALAGLPASARRTTIFQRNGDVFAELIDTP